MALSSSYFMSRALLPSSHKYTRGQQIALAGGFTFVLLGFAQLGLSYVPWGISFWSLVIALAVVSVLQLGIAAYLGGFGSGRARSGLRAKGVHGWLLTSWKDKASWLFLGLATVSALGLAPILVEGRQEAFTELFVNLDELDETRPWKEAVPLGTEVGIPVTVVSHEMRQKESFYLQVTVDDQVHRVIDFGSLESGQEVTREVLLSMEQEGYHTVDFGLYKAGALVPYRSLRVGLRVVSSPVSPKL
jgi:uncharacterized membrane protein